MLTAEARETKIRKVFDRAGGVLRTGDALRAGVHPRDLYALRDSGALEQVSRGVYRLTELPPLAEPDLAVVALRVPRAVIALVSALHFHGLTTEIPHEVSMALPKRSSRPKLGWPPIRVYWFSEAMFLYGIETHERDGAKLRVYGAAKTVADCVKFRNRLGIDIALDALRAGIRERKFTEADVMRAARVCRVAKVIRPYLEAIQ